MRTSLASRKIKKSYKTLIQNASLQGAVLPDEQVSYLYTAVGEAIVAMRQTLLAKAMRATKEQIEAQDNSDLDIVTISRENNQGENNETVENRQ